MTVAKVQGSPGLTPYRVRLLKGRRCVLSMVVMGDGANPGATAPSGMFGAEM